MQLSAIAILLVCCIAVAAAGHKGKSQHGQDNLKNINLNGVTTTRRAGVGNEGVQISSTMDVTSGYAAMDGAMGGESFASGTHVSATGITVAPFAAITLDGGINMARSACPASQADGPVFKFYTPSLTTGASVTFILENCALAHNVYWIVTNGGNAALGANTEFVGNIIAGGTISTGAGVTVEGDLLAVGAVSLGVGKTTEGADEYSGTMVAELDQYGDVTSHAGAITLGATSSTGSLSTQGGPAAPGANTDPDTAPGVGAITLGAGAIVADAHAGGAITLGASARCQDAQSGDAFTAGANAETGSVVSGAAITLGAGTKVTGTLSAGAAKTLGAGTMCRTVTSTDFEACPL